MEMLFCYCCRSHHPKDQMQLFPTRQGMRWRCTRSIEAANRSRHERDAFGREQTLINRQSSVAAAEYVHLRQRLLQPA